MIVVNINSQGFDSVMNLEYENTFDHDLYKSVIDPIKCKEQLEFLLSNISMAMNFLDASGKIPNGLMVGNLADLGSYYQCLNIQHQQSDMEIQGKYCMIQIPIQYNKFTSNYAGSFTPWTNFTGSMMEDMKKLIATRRQVSLISGFRQSFLAIQNYTSNSNNGPSIKLSWGICIPKVCRTDDFLNYIQQQNISNIDRNLTYKELFCRLSNDKPYSIADYVAIAIFSLLALITAISTSYDLYHVFVLHLDKSQISSLYRCFSIYTNTTRFLTFNNIPGALECVDGIRAISMLWVIFGHTYAMTMITSVYNMTDVMKWLTSFGSIWINSAPITVDTFFTLSGILCVYTVIGKISRRRFISSLHLFYLNRLLRLFPLLAAVVLLQASIFHRISDGPMWINNAQMVALCRKRWWSALLHVQNYVKPLGMCLYHTWYLSVDIQLYIISPILLIWLFGSKWMAWSALATSVLATLVMSSTYSFLYNFSAAMANPKHINEMGDYFEVYYINTLARAPPFVIGMMYGYILNLYKGMKLQMKTMLVLTIWTLALGSMAFCIFAIYPVMQVQHDNQLLDNFLNAYMRAIWALALGWIIFACVHGYGGPVNWFLSLQVWKLPARLSYAMYLIHYPIIMLANGSMVSSYYFTDGNTLYRAMGDLGFTLIAAFIICITIDAPFSTLQKILLQEYGFGVRHIQMICMCFVMITLFIARGSLGVAILAMTDVRRKNETNIDIYDWDKKTQGLILSSFFWGYAVMQIPAGLLSKRYGAKPILLFSLLTNAVICGLLPTLVRFGGWQIACACRVFMGLTQACLYPASHTLLGKWLPQHERTLYTSLVYGGSQIGIIIAMPVSGILAETALGWKLIFYSISLFMVVTAGVWVFFSANSPGDHRLMTDGEREYIENGLNVAAPKILKTPWKEIFMAKEFYAIMMTHIGCAICFILFFVDMPTYLEKALQISLKNSASLSALPYIGMLIGNVSSAAICEKLHNKGYLSLVACRKLFNSLAFVGMAIGLAILSFIGPEQKSIAIVTLIATLTLNGCFAAGFIMSFLDMSPNYAGVLLSVTNFVANIGGILTPIATSFILRNDPTDTSGWRIVFLSAAGIALFCNTAYLVFGTAKCQEWDDPDYLNKRKADPGSIKYSIYKKVKIFANTAKQNIMELAAEDL
ncbi:unnamed protein product, partial [Brenthis ino]